MSTGRKNKGDHVSVADELLSGIPALEQKVKVIDKAVQEGYMTLGKALSAYKVKEFEYLAYKFYNNSLTTGPATSKESQFYTSIEIIANAFQESMHLFKPKGKKALVELEAIAKKLSPVKVRAK